MTLAKAIAGFKKSSIYPYNAGVISDNQYSYIAPYEIQTETVQTDSPEQVTAMSTNFPSETSKTASFLAKRFPKFVPPFKKFKRQNEIVTSGKAETE